MKEAVTVSAQITTNTTKDHSQGLRIIVVITEWLENKQFISFRFKETDYKSHTRAGCCGWLPFA